MLKIHVFFRLCLPVHPSIRPSVNTSWRPAWNPGGWSHRPNGDASKIIFNDLSSELKSESDSKINYLFFLFTSYFIFHFFFFIFCCSPYLFSFFLFVVLKSSHKRYTAFRFRIKYSTCKTREILYKGLSTVFLLHKGSAY